MFYNAQRQRVRDRIKEEQDADQATPSSLLHMWEGKQKERKKKENESSDCSMKGAHAVL